MIGQDEAVALVSAAIRRSRVQISPRRRPASFIFVGPTGVGKTELVKQLANELFDTPETLIRLDMSEFMEKHSVSRIIGSPPGYVGYDEAGQLTEKVRRKPIPSSYSTKSKRRIRMCSTFCSKFSTRAGLQMRRAARSILRIP